MVMNVFISMHFSLRFIFLIFKFWNNFLTIIVELFLLFFPLSKFCPFQDTFTLPFHQVFVYHMLLGLFIQRVDNSNC